MLCIHIPQRTQNCSQTAPHACRRSSASPPFCHAELSREVGVWHWASSWLFYYRSFSTTSVQSVFITSVTKSRVLNPKTENTNLCILQSLRTDHLFPQMLLIQHCRPCAACGGWHRDSIFCAQGTNFFPFAAAPPPVPCSYVALHDFSLRPDSSLVQWRTRLIKIVIHQSQQILH